MTQIFEQAKKQGYKTVNWNLLQLQEDEMINSDKLLRSFCIAVTRNLNLTQSLDEVWDKTLGSKDNCTYYFEDYILPQLDVPLVLALDNVDRVFPFQAASTDFLELLRYWYEVAKTNELWQRVRWVIAHSTADYPRLNINKSPFNVGKAIELPEFNVQQVQDLSRRYGLSLEINQITKLMDLVGGHPYLVRETFEQIKAHPDLSIDKILELAPTNAGIYSNYLRDILETLKQNPELVAAIKTVIEADKPVMFDERLVFKLDSLGLVCKQGNHVVPQCNLYRLYFKEKL